MHLLFHSQNRSDCTISSPLNPSQIIAWPRVLPTCLHLRHQLLLLWTLWGHFLVINCTFWPNQICHENLIVHKSSSSKIFMSIFFSLYQVKFSTHCDFRFFFFSFCCVGFGCKLACSHFYLFFCCIEVQQLVSIIIILPIWFVIHCIHTCAHMFYCYFSLYNNDDLMTLFLHERWFVKFLSFWKTVGGANRKFSFA